MLLNSRPHLNSKTLMEFRELLKSFFTGRACVRVSAGNRWCTQIRIILRGVGEGTT